MDIKIKLQDQQLRRLLNRLVKRGDDLSPAMDAISGVLADVVEESFDKEQAPDGTAWAKLSSVTIARRQKSGRGTGKILQQTGRLAQSIVAAHGSDFAQAGTNVIYAATHQFGAKKGQFGTTKRGAPIPWGDIPARSFLGLSDEGRDEIIEILTAHLTPGIS